MGLDMFWVIGIWACIIFLGIVFGAALISEPLNGLLRGIKFKPIKLICVVILLTPISIILFVCGIAWMFIRDLIVPLAMELWEEVN